MRLARLGRAQGRQPAALPAVLSDERSRFAVEVLMEEYKALRQEVVTSITAQAQLLTFGWAAVGVLTVAGTSLRDRSALSSMLVFLGLLPVVCYLGLQMWLGEVIRMLRVGAHLRRLERRVNRHVRLDGDPLLSWETWAHERDQANVERTHLRWVGSSYLLVAGGAIAFGYYEADRFLQQRGHRWDEHPGPALAVIVALAVCGLLLSWYVTTRAYRRAEKLRTCSVSRPAQHG